MTALIGSAVFGLVPLPSTVTSNSWGRRCDHWLSEAATSAHHIFLPQAIVERSATRERACGPKRVGDIDGDLTNRLDTPG
jgi:hypothetical protein